MSSRTTGGTLAAWLILAAILGFAAGAFFGLQSDGTDEPRTQPTTVADDGDASSSDDGDNSGSDDNSDSSDDVDDTSSPDETPSDSEYDIELTMEKTEVEEEEDINFTITVDPPQAGVVLRLERRLDGSEWALFSENVGPYATNSDGKKETSIWSGQVGKNEFRLVDTDDESNVSNVVAVTVAEES